MSPRKPRERKRIPSFDYLTFAENTLFPNLPYHFLTQEQREQTYEYAKNMIQQKTGLHIP